MTIVSLSHLWWGVCVGGKHYTGEVSWHDSEGWHKEEMRRKLTLKQAKEFGETEGRLWLLRLQRDTNKFDTLHQLERKAMRWCAEKFPDGWALFENESNNPNRLIGGTGVVKDLQQAANVLASVWDQIPNSQRDWDKEPTKGIYKAWDVLIKALTPTSVSPSSPS